MKITLWVPGLYDRKGGIQLFSHFFLKALCENLNSSSDRITVISMHDKNLSVENVQATSIGALPAFLRTLGFIIVALVRAAIDRPDIIISTHIHFGPVAWIIRKTLKTQYWLVAHGVEAWNISNSSTKFALRSADKILAVSEITRSLMIQANYVTPDRCIVFYNTADSDRFTIQLAAPETRVNLGIPSIGKILLSVGRMDASEKYKGFDEILRAIAILKDRNLFVVFVGDGNDRQRIINLANELGVTEQVRILGQVSDQDLPALYCSADAFVMPSRGEGFGIVFLEALFSGVPCIAGNSDGAQEALFHEDLGLLVPPTNISLLAEAILIILYRTTSQQQLREQALSRFGYELFSTRLKKLLQESSINP